MGFKAPCEAAVHMAFDWDDNSRFFHSLASSRKCRNFIQTLQPRASCTPPMQQKRTSSTSSMVHSLIGSTTPVSWDFHLCDLCPDLTVWLDMTSKDHFLWKKFPVLSMLRTQMLALAQMSSVSPLIGQSGLL